MAGIEPALPKQNFYGILYTFLQVVQHHKASQNAADTSGPLSTSRASCPQLLGVCLVWAQDALHSKCVFSLSSGSQGFSVNSCPWCLRLEYSQEDKWLGQDVVREWSFGSLGPSPVYPAYTDVCSVRQPMFRSLRTHHDYDCGQCKQLPLVSTAGVLSGRQVAGSRCGQRVVTWHSSSPSVPCIQ